MSSTSTRWSSESNTKAGAATIDISTQTSGDLTVAGELTVTGNKITFGNNEYISNAADEFLIMTGHGVDDRMLLALQSGGTGEDSGIVFMEGTHTRWTMQQDASDNSDYSLIWDYEPTGTVAGAAPRMDLDSSGNLEIAGDLTISGGNITNALTCDSTLTVTGALTSSSYLDITVTTDSSDASGDTGALRCEGGASIAKKLYVGTDLDVDGTTNLDAVDIDGAVQLDSTFTVGVNDTGYDVTFFGATSGKKLLWDESADELVLVGNGTKLSFYDAAGGENISADASGVLSIAGGAEIDLTSVIVDINATTTCTIDNTNTSNGVVINAATSGSPISIGHTTSETTINDNLTITGNVTASAGITTQNMLWGAETVAAGDGSGNATALSITKIVSFVTTANNSSHVSLADGNATAGQIKIIIHKTLANGVSLVITPANFAAGATLTSDAASRGVMLIFDGTNWQIMGGEVTGTAEFVIAS